LFKVIRKFFRALDRKSRQEKQWRERNPHNGTTIVNDFPFDLVKVGNHSYGPLEVHAWHTAGEGLSIGHFCSIAEGVKFLLGGEHRYDTMLTYPIQAKFFGVPVESISKGPILVEDDVWIGTDALVMSGVRIGKGAIIGAGSVVTRDIPAYSISCGNPARAIKYRFPDEIIGALIQIDLSKVTESIIRSHRDLFETALEGPPSLERLKALASRLEQGE
jgi:acetyltransferase-like isoleucine patch superfamily enzyme